MEFFNTIKRTHWTLFFSISMVVGLLFSPVVLSLGMIGFCCAAFLDISLMPKRRLALRSDLGKQWYMFLREPIFWSFTLFFLLPLLGCLYTEDWDYGLRRLRLKLPCLILPFAFFVVPSISRRYFWGLLYLFLGILSVTALVVLGNYMLHFEAVQKLLLQGQPMPVPRNHIRFSLLVAIGIIGGISLLRERFVWKYDWERWGIGVMTLFLFVFIHVLSVRSGVLVLYAALGALLVQYIFQSRSYIVGFFGILGLVLLPVLAYFVVPSWKAKIDYMRWDLKMYQGGNGATYSDSGRLISYQVGMEIIRAHPVLGVGTGDLKKEVHRVYGERFPKMEELKMPHNQWMSVWAAHGVLGFVIFIGAFFYPLWKDKNFRFSMLMGVYAIMFSAFMIENTIESSTGLGIFLFFALWSIKYLSTRNRLV